MLSVAAATPQASGQRTTSAATPPLSFGRHQHRGVQPAVTAPPTARPDSCGMPPPASHARPPLREITPADRSPATAPAAWAAANRQLAVGSAAEAGHTARGGVGSGFAAHQQPRSQGGVSSGSGPGGSTRAGSEAAAGNPQPLLPDDHSRSMHGDDAYSGIQNQGTEGALQGCAAACCCVAADEPD